MISFRLRMTPDGRLWPRRTAFRVAALMLGKERRLNSTRRGDLHGDSSFSVSQVRVISAERRASRRAESVVLDLMCHSSPPRWRDTSDVAGQLGNGFGPDGHRQLQRNAAIRR